jgi:DNA-binding NarL/FixJ family response regulator
MFRLASAAWSLRTAQVPKTLHRVHVVDAGRIPQLRKGSQIAPKGVADLLLKGRGYRRWPSATAQGRRPCDAAEPPQSPVSGAKRRKCAQIIKNLLPVKLRCGHGQTLPFCAIFGTFIIANCGGNEPEQMANMEAKISILLADDQTLITQSLTTFLSNYAEDMTVIGTASNGREAVAVAEKEHPDIILMDVLMPEMDGIEAVGVIKNNYPEIKAIMLSTYDEDEYVRAAIMAGASGYLLKTISPTELITVIRALKNNVIQISPEIARKMVQQKYNGSSPKSGSDLPNMTESLPWLKTLTKREREIFTYITIGYENEEIAAKLNLAPQTIKNQVSTIYSKLGVKNRFEIIKLANKR